MTNLVILPELKNLLPPLTESEYAGLEKDILERGCISPLATWNDAIVDGHNRYEICQKHGLPFEVRRLEFASLDEARFWAWTHQENRRNLTPYQRGELALQFKSLIAQKAQKNKTLSGGDKKSHKAKSVSANSPGPISGIDTRVEIAKIADVSENTISRIEYLDKHADEETKNNLRQGKTTINREYKRAKEQAADPKPKKTRPNKTKVESSVTEPSETLKPSETSPSRPMTCVEELGPPVVRTTLQNIRQDKPDQLVRSLDSHFREGFIEDLVMESMKFLHETKGSAVTVPMAEEIAKCYLQAE